MNEQAVVSLQRVRQPDGSYVIILPVNTTDEVYVDMAKNINLTQKLLDIINDINHNEDSIIQDLVTLITQVSPLINSNVQFNHLFRDDLMTLDNFNLISGIYRSGTLLI